MVGMVRDQQQLLLAVVLPPMVAVLQDQQTTTLSLQQMVWVMEDLLHLQLGASHCQVGLQLLPQILLLLLVAAQAMHQERLGVGLEEKWGQEMDLGHQQHCSSERAPSWLGADWQAQQRA